MQPFSRLKAGWFVTKTLSKSSLLAGCDEGHGLQPEDDHGEPRQRQSRQGSGKAAAGVS